jgi:hypothetical protein
MGLVLFEERATANPRVGTELVGKLSYYESRIVALANILYKKQMLTPTEVAEKMDEIAARRQTRGLDLSRAAVHKEFAAGDKTAFV